jgi:hypothetical protein
MNEKDKEFEYTAGMDIADTVVFMLVCALICIVVFI